MNDEQPLTAAHLQFVAELASDPRRNQTAAYLRVYGCSYETARSAAAALLRNPRIRAELSKYDEATRERNRLTVDRLTQHVAELVEADPRDLVEFHRGACRHCHGYLHRYQFTQNELERAVERYKRDNAEAVRRKLPGVVLDPLGAFFDYQGGVGYNPKREPHPGCPECFGDGIGYEVFKDTRDLPPAAARLYSGVQRTKEGLKLITRSQDKALELAMRTAGMLTEKDKSAEGDDMPPSTVTYEEIDASDPDQPRVGE